MTASLGKEKEQQQQPNLSLYKDNFQNMFLAGVILIKLGSKLSAHVYKWTWE